MHPLFLPLPVVLGAFSQGMELATTLLGQQKPQQYQDDKLMGELDIEEKHRFLCSYWFEDRLWEVIYTVNSTGY